MHFSLKQALTWLVLFICAGLIINGLYERTEDNNNKSETLVATDWKVIKTNIGGSTYSEEDDDYEIGDDIHLNVKVSFDLNGGEMSSDFGNSKIVSTNEKYGALPTPHRKGYNFEGWYTKVTGGTKITQDSIVKINRNHTLFAHWNPIQYNLAYYHNNTLLGSYAHLYNQDITIKNYTDFQISKRGYTFKGWLDDADVLHEAGSVVSRLTEKENSTFKLRSEWTPNVYNVHFDPNGGVTPQASKKVTFDSAYGTLPTPTRQYYTFTGWYTEKDGGTKVTEKDIYQIDGDTTLYAHWVQNTYTITFIVGDKTYVVTAFEGEEVQEPDTTKQGYTFTGWFTKASGGTKVTDFGYKTQTVYAQWKANNYLLTFDPNGGSVSPATKQVTYDSKYGTLPTPVKTGYTFKGWHLPDGTKIDSNDIVQILEDTTVTASWQANVYTVNFYNGTTKIGSKQYTYDQQGDLPLFKTFNVNKTGYTFKGWGVNASQTTPTYQDGQRILNLSAINNSTVNLYTVWQANKYTVTYISDGKVYGNSQFTYDKEARLTTAKDLSLTKQGYTFQGWAVTENGAVKYGDGASVKNLTPTPDGNVNLYAVWKANNYTIKYYSEGKLIGDSLHVYDTASNLKTAKELRLSKTGYTFQGWATSSNSSTVVYRDGQSVKNLSTGGTVNLFAVWKANNYTITLNPNGGTVNPTTLTVTYDAPYGTLPTPSRTGYTFIGWYLGNTQITEDSIVKVTSDTTLVAKWNANKYTLTFDPNGGTLETTTKTVVYDAPYGILPTPNRTGYTFKGWHLPDGTKITSNDIVKITADTTVTASWQANVYTVNFYNGSTKIGSQRYTYDLEGELPLFKTFNISKTGYTFKGWGLSASQSTPNYQDGQKILNLSSDNNSTVNLYTVWQANKYTVTYISDGKTYGTSQFTYDKAAILTTIKDLSLSKSGYTFQGWSTTATGTAKYSDGASVKNLTSTPNGNVKLYAIWKANDYTIKYYSEGNLVGSSSHTFDVASNLKTIKALGVNKTGYTFQGWATSSNSSTVVYRDGQSIKNLSTSETINLYAVWKANTYTITLNPNGGTVNPTTLTVTYDKAYGTLPTPTRTGYTFAGWYLGNTQITKDSIVKVTSNSTLVAKWTANKYTVTFDPVGGTLETTSKTVTYDAPYGILPTPSKTGYGFEGWYLNGTQITSNSIVKITSNVTLTAKWSANKYTIEYYNAGVKVGSSAHAFNAAQNLKTDTQLNISKTGYSLAGWSTSSTSNTVAYKNGEQVINLTTTNNVVIKLYAIWSPNTYTVTFDPNGGTGGPTTQNFVFNRGDKLTTSIPSRKGYTFTHWQRSDNANYTFKPGDVIPNGWLSFKLSAQWKANTYNVEYYNGTIKVGTSAHTYDVAKTLTTASTLKLSKTGYSFAGWTTSSGSSTVNYKDGASVANLTPTNNGTVKLYAVWQANQYTVTFNPNGGSVNPASKTVTYNSTYGTLPTPTRAGYNFAGWYLNDTQIITGTKVTTASNHTLIAKWTQLQNTKYTVKHYLMNVNGVGYTLKETQGLQGPTDNTIIIKDHAKSFTGFSYASCKLDGSSTDTTSSTTTIKGDGSRVLNLYYTRNRYTITVNKATGINTVTNSFTQYYQSNASVTATIATGYHWSQWNSSNTNILPSSTNQTYTFTVPASNVTLTAIAGANTYTVTFDPNGGTGGPKTQNFVYNRGDELTTAIPSKTGYTFTHWQKSDNANYTFKPGAVIPNGWGSFKLVAQWKANTYNVEYYNGTTKVGTSSHTYNTAKALTTASSLKLSKAGYSFAGWSTSSGGSTVNYKDGASVSNLTATNNGTVKLYAVWTANKYTVTFNPNGGSVNPTSKTVTYNSTYGTLPTPTRAGYNFAGWYLNNAQITATSKVTTSTNHALVAKWSQIQNTKYTVKHYLMNVNGVGYTLKETQSLQGPTDNTIIIKDHAKSFTGFTYASCKLDGSSTDTTSSTTTIKGDGSRVLNLYYTRNRYTITVNKGTGINTVTNSFTQYYQSNASVTATIVTGYHWSKWNSSNTNILPASTNQTYTFTMPASNITLTAIAEANTYTVTYNANGGTGGPTTQSFKFNSGAKLSTSIPSRTGYTFVHWQFTGNPNYTFQPSAAIPSGWGSFTLEAIWQANTQSITINPNGGTYLGGGTKTITGKTDELKPIVKPFKSGYTFNKWTLSGGGSLHYYGLQLKNSQAFSTGTDGLVVYNNSGNGNVTHARVPATSDNPMGSPYQMNITNKGASSPGLGGFHTTVPSKANGAFYHVFVAKAPKGSTLNIANNAVGTGSKFTWLTPNKGTGNFETYIYNLQCGPSGTFSTFGFIYLTGATSPVTWQVAYSNIFDATGGLTRANTDTVLKVGSGASTLTATWTANNYNVEYYNGSTKVGSAVHTYDVGKNLTPASVLGLSKTGYTFAGWSTKSGSTTAQYTDNQSVKNLTTTSGGTVKLYAVWKANPETTFTVKHYLMNTNGSTYSLNSTLSYKGQTDSTITLSNYRKSFTGFTYKETRLDGSSTPTSGNTTTIAPNGSRVINIYYSRNKYQITVGKGTGIASTTNTFTAYYGTSQKITATMSTGYHWGKWDSLNDALLADSANQTYTFTMPAGNVTINATAVANTYTIRYYNGPTLLGSSTHTYNTSKLLTSGASLKAVKAGYDFVGWDTSNAGAIVRLDDEQSVSNLTSTNGGTVNIYAVFSDIGKQITTVQNKMNYPIGMVIQTPTATNPSSVYGGQWQQIASGRTLVGVDESNSNFNTVKKTGGTMTETLTINQMPRHNHNGSTNNTGSHSHAFHSNASPTYGVAYYINNGSYNYVPTKHSKNHIKLGHISLGTDGAHSHSFTTSNTGGGASHDNMQPYYGVYIWEKIGN